MSDFRVSIVNGQVKVLSEDDVPETDIIDLLEFDETRLETLYLTHAAIQARWEQIAINLCNAYERFDEEFVKKWWAYNKRFAKLSLEGAGELKPTVDAIKDTTILIYSMDTLDIERDRYAEWAHKAVSKKGSSDFDLKDSFEDFKKGMFRYLLQSPKWYFESVISVSKEMQKNYLTAENISKRLETRSYHMKELKDLLSAKHGNIGPMSYSQKNAESFLEESIKKGNLK
jgi:hypothetical protein